MNDRDGCPSGVLDRLMGEVEQVADPRRFLTPGATVTYPMAD
jgi:hypothetical protein